jgi:hypothetical protein
VVPAGSGPAAGRIAGAAASNGGGAGRQQEEKGHEGPSVLGRGRRHHFHFNAVPAVLRLRRGVFALDARTALAVLALAAARGEWAAKVVATHPSAAKSV